MPGPVRQMPWKYVTSIFFTFNNQPNNDKHLVDTCVNMPTCVTEQPYEMFWQSECTYIIWIWALEMKLSDGQLKELRQWAAVNVQKLFSHSSISRPRGRLFQTMRTGNNLWIMCQSFIIYPHINLCCSQISQLHSPHTCEVIHYIRFVSSCTCVHNIKIMSCMQCCLQ